MMGNLFKTLQFQVSSKKALRIQPMLELIETGARTEAETLLFQRKGYFCVCVAVSLCYIRAGKMQAHQAMKWVHIHA